MPRISAPGTGRSEFNSPWLNSKFEASLGYMKPCLKHCLKMPEDFSASGPQEVLQVLEDIYSICLLV